MPLTREAEEPAPLPYLSSNENAAHGAFDIQLQVWLETVAMRERRASPKLLSQTSFRHAYWTLAQLVTHHTVNGCNLRPGDLLGTGTQSGPGPRELGSLMELTQSGTRPLELDGETRGFLQDGDRVTFRAFCERPGASKLGFGTLRAEVLPAHPLPAD
jgi:fumarylacetoacetase